MSKEEINQIINSFNHQEYCIYTLNLYNQTHYKNKWSYEKIISTLQKAFSYGFHGIHFIPLKYEGAIVSILEQYLGSDHYISYRICTTHDMIILQPNYHKLGISPQKVLKSSFSTDKTIHALQEKQQFASFCFED